MDRDEYRKVRDFISKNALNMMKAGKKNYAKTGFPDINYTIYDEDKNRYYIVKTNTFKALTEEVLPEARKIFTDLFGTGDAKDVINAIYQIRPLFFTFERYCEFINNEQFCYVVENTDGELTEKILRIDLFRHIKPNNTGKFDFVGGLLHAAKHFSIENIPLTTGQEISNIVTIDDLIFKISKAFYSNNLKHDKGQNYNSYVPMSKDYEMKVAFHFDVNANVYFVNTAHLQKKFEKGT